MKLETEAGRLQHRLKLLNADPRASHDYALRYGWQDEWDTNVAKGVISMTPRSICGSVQTSIDRRHVIMWAAGV